MENFKPSMPTNEQVNNRKKFETALKEVESITDARGLEIDKNIKETVAIFRAMGFPTSSSCEGHKSEQEGYALPYVEVYDQAPIGWKEDKEKQKDWKRANLLYQEKLLPFLNEFNSKNIVDEKTKIQIMGIGIFGGFRLSSSDLSDVKSLNDAVNRITLGQQEMNRLTNFLKDKFLQ